MCLPWMAWPIRPEFQPPAVTDGLDGHDGLLGRPISRCSKRHTLYMNLKWTLNSNEAPEMILGHAKLQFAAALAD